MQLDDDFEVLFDALNRLDEGIEDARDAVTEQVQMERLEGAEMITVDIPAANGDVPTRDEAKKRNDRDTSVNIEAVAKSEN